MADILKFTKAQAQAIMERFRADMERNETDAINSIPKNLGSSGYAGELIDLIEAYPIIVDSSGYDGIRVTAQALEEVEGQYQSPLNELRMFVVEYVETLDNPSAIDYRDAKQAQAEQNITEIRIAMDNKIGDILDELDQEKEREEEREREREEKQRERERRKQEQQQIESEYYKTRERLQKQVRRRKNAGVDLDFEIPDIPQRITQGSINRLQNLIDYVQDEYRYLQGRGYRGQK